MTLDTKEGVTRVAQKIILKLPVDFVVPFSGLKPGQFELRVPLSIGSGHWLIAYCSKSVCPLAF